jgi:MFS family permease
VDDLEKEKVRLLNYGLIVMIVSHTLTHVFRGIHTAIFSILRDEFTLSLQQLGLIAAIPSLCQAILAVPTGILSDRIGSKKMLLLSFGFATLGAILAGIATNPLMLVVAISLVHINTTIYHPASYSYTTKLFKSGDRSKALGLHGAGGTLGYAIGPLAVSFLVGILAWQWRNVYLVLTIPMIIGIGMVLLLKEEDNENIGLETQPDTSSENNRFLTTSLFMFLLYQALRSMGRSMIASFLVLWLLDLRNMSITIASFIASATTLSGILAAPLGGYIASRLGDMRWLQASFLVSLCFLGLAFNLPSNTAFTGFYVAYGFFTTLGMAPRNSIIAKLTPRKQRGLGFALLFLPGSIVGAIAPVIAGYIAENIGLGNIFNVALLVNFISFIILKYAVKIKD